MATTAVPRSKLSGGSFLLETRRPDEVFTPEDFTEQQQLIGQTAEEFAQNEIVPNVERMEHKDFSVTRDLLKKAGELGLSSVEIPEAYGGLEMDKVTAAVIADHIAKYAGFATTWGGHTGIGTLPIVYFGTEEQKKKYLPRLAAGELVGAYALSEASSGSDAMNCRARATLSPDGKHYILNGEKMWITNAGFADLFTVFAKIDGEKFTAFLVEKSFPGFSIGGEEHKMGIRGSSTCPIILNDCKVPVENLLGEIGKGHVIAFNILNVGRFKLGAMCVGGARLSLENAIAYAKQRKAFSKVIADFGLVREKLANMATLIYVGESLVYRTVGMMDVALADVDKSGADAAKETRKAIDGLARFFSGIGAGLIDIGKRDVHHANGAVDQRLADIDQRRHVGQLLAHQTEVGDDFAEGLALLGIGDGVFQRDTASAHAHGTELEAADVEDVEGDHMPFADFAQQIFDRNFAVVEDDGTGGRSANAHLVLFTTDRESRESFPDQESGELFAVDLGEDSEQVGEAGVGDPHFLAVQDVVFAIR